MEADRPLLLVVTGIAMVGRSLLVEGRKDHVSEEVRDGR